MITDPAAPPPTGVTEPVQNPAPPHTSEPFGDHPGDRQVHPVGYRPVDWDAAVRAAAVLLDGGHYPAGQMANPALAPMAQDLAARLCAYSSGEETPPWHTKPPPELHPQSGTEPAPPTLP